MNLLEGYLWQFLFRISILRLGIVRTSEQEIEEGIGIIAKELEHAKQQVKSTTTTLIWV
ncbi:hypothetical protein [Paenibacillus sp. P13VS]|uniref:hypothetical protein n=1 Tax=Paenibacillus sp. P13VS TaxID=2697367 RepID=UPI001D102B07|nr:hypothetical protein [Paenibacillus sp. P13VS]